MELVRWFDTLGRHDLAVAGGKGANLGETARAGLPVPPGFVVTTAAYDAFVEANGLGARIAAIAAAVSAAATGAPGAPVAADSAAAADAASAEIRAMFAAGEIPADVATAIRSAYAELGQGLVAVRSSATAEDLPGASFAGQQDTYLHLDGEAQVLGAVRRCWSSLWTARAISYRARQGIGAGGLSLAVVVQRLVQADTAGVLFTANPVNGRRDQLVIDGAWGLGEAVVSGQVTPDHWVIDAPSGAILEEHVATKEVRTVPVPGGTETVATPADLRDRPCLDAAAIQALVDLGGQVAAHYGSPQDLEWAFAAGRLYLLQARPITSLFPLPRPVARIGLPFAEAVAPAGSASPQPLRVWVSGNNMQGVLEPLTPMGLSALAAFGSGVARLWGFDVPLGEAPPAAVTAAGRIYLEVTNALHHPPARRAILGATYAMDRPIADCLQALLDREPSLSEPAPFTGRPRAGFALRMIALTLFTFVAPDAARRRAHSGPQRWIASMEAAAADLPDAAARLRFVQLLLPNGFVAMVRYLAAVVFPALGLRFVAEARLRRWLGDDAAMKPVLRSLPHNPTTEMDLALWRLSRELKATGAEPTADHPGVQAFLARYGHRGVREIDMGMPRWRDDPTQVLETLRTYLSHDENSDPEAQFRQGAEAAEAAARDLVQRVRREQGWWRAAQLRFLLSRTRKLVGLREYPKFLAVRLIALGRRVLMEAGEELAAAGRLDRADDIFFLTFQTALDSSADLRSLAAANRAEYERELQRKRIPRVLTSLGETFYGSAPATPGSLPGTAASAGMYEGRVRVVLNPKGASLEPGEVLVAPGTDPAWTPLFLSAGALVMEVGGIMSHGSVVAREYGIPAVVGVADATHVLHTGQRVRVDGESGQVVPLGD